VSVKDELERQGVDPAGTGIKLVAYRSETAKLALDRRYRLDQLETAFFVRASGQVFQGLDAFPPVLPNLSGGTLVLWGLRFGMARRLAELGYCLVVHHRDRWFGVAQPTR
jgi:predicted DCC family thiol-disulfide oxidoreductase YuxK